MIGKQISKVLIEKKGWALFKIEIKNDGERFIFLSPTEALNPIREDDETLFDFSRVFKKALSENFDGIDQGLAFKTGKLSEILAIDCDADNENCKELIENAKTYTEVIYDKISSKDKTEGVRLFFELKNVKELKANNTEEFTFHYGDFVSISGFVFKENNFPVREMTINELKKLFGIDEISDVNQLNNEKKGFLDLNLNINPDNWWNFKENEDGEIVKTDFQPDKAGNDIISNLKILTEYNDVIHVFVKDRWLREGENFIRSILQFYAPELKPYPLNATVDYIKNITRVSDPEKIEIPLEEAYPLPDYLIPIKNGLFNVGTHELTPHSPEYFYMSIIPRNYISGAKAENFRAFLEKIFYDDPEKDIKITQIYEIFAWVIFPRYLPHGMVFLLGEGGEGKGILQRILEAFLGEGNYTSTGLSELENDKFAKANLFGMKANIISESGETLTNSQVVKTCTTEDMIKAERKWGFPFLFRNRAKFIIATNRMPIPKEDMDESRRDFWRRVLLIINFKHYLNDLFSEQEIMEWERKIISENELDRIFSEVMENHYIPFTTKLKFTDQLDLEKAQEKYMDFANPSLSYIQYKVENGEILTDLETVKKWITENGFDPKDFLKENKERKDLEIITVKDVILNDAKEWAKKRNLPHELITTVLLGNALKKFDYPNINDEKRIKRTLKRAWLGVFIIPDNLNLLKNLIVEDQKRSQKENDKKNKTEFVRSPIESYDQNDQKNENGVSTVSGQEKTVETDQITHTTTFQENSVGSSLNRKNLLETAGNDVNNERENQTVSTERVYIPMHVKEEINIKKKYRGTVETDDKNNKEIEGFHAVSSVFWGVETVETDWKNFRFYMIDFYFEPEKMEAWGIKVLDHFNYNIFNYYAVDDNYKIKGSGAHEYSNFVLRAEKEGGKISREEFLKIKEEYLKSKGGNENGK